MVYRIAEIDEDPLEYLETYQRRMMAFSELVSDALKRSGAEDVISDTVERLFLQVSLLLRSVIKDQLHDAEKATFFLEYARDLLNGTAWLTEIAVIKYKADRGYKLTGAIFRIQCDGLAALIERVKAGETG
ncbi:hypothetical protein [Endozoicomonas acroporae]|uniref:hypothetical protein n=1 Tax=Endozoicomonas acroporae TaxID=1701104 RepID=UPI0013D74654|nr:hypothetical protein [Endozoicomonas acroporae]